MGAQSVPAGIGETEEAESQQINMQDQGESNNYILASNTLDSDENGWAMGPSSQGGQ